MGKTVEIHLGSKVFIDAVAIIDEIDIEVSNAKWHLDPKGYAKTNVFVDSKKTTRFLHRVILERLIGRPLVKGEFCDHRDGNRLNNTRSNLRLASSAENSRNRQSHLSSTSIYKGVSWRKDKNKWHAAITYNGKKLFLGLFDDPKDAAAAYNRAALKYFGEFARLNDIPDEAQS